MAGAVAPPAPATTWVLPRALSLAGNSKAWLALARMVRTAEADPAPVLVHGPIGCGKTVGVAAVCSGHGRRRFVVDAAMTHREVLDVFDHLCGASCFGQRAVLCVEDADGMPPDMITTIDRGLTRFPNVLVVATACNRYSTRLSKWRGWRNVRLFRPRPADVEQLVCHLHPQAARSTVAALARECEGDIRRCVLAMRWGMGVATIDAQHTIFEGTQALFARKQSAREYAVEFADARNICTELAFRNYPAVGQAELTMAHLTQVADAFSMVDAHACDATWLALCGHLREVLPLTASCPPLYLAKMAPEARRSRSESLDCPALLGGCALSCSAHQSRD